ncbi:hypothetical protein C0995_012679 [Termitomyces sp. Mi166|nr:hypothetical protein C0995_012679 [Termitomyces sp. Mi166\
MSLQPSDVDHLSDKEILERFMNVPWMEGEGRVKRLTPKTIVKPTMNMEDLKDMAEANALNLVFAESTIPVPRVHRVITTSESFFIVMDYIPGQTLAETLRRYIRRLRRLEAPCTTPPGPVSGNGPLVCRSPLFGYVRSTHGPFASYAELSHFFNERHKMAADLKKIPLDDPSRANKFDDSEALVLTHQDLNLRNMILGEDGRLSIIDWGWSGYYPRWFEHIAMQRQNQSEDISGTNDKFWKVLIPFIAGPYFQQEAWSRRVCTMPN